MGADHTILVEKTSPEELAKKIREILGAPPDITLECSGAGPSITTGILVHFSVCVRACVRACVCACVHACVCVCVCVSPYVCMYVYWVCIGMLFSHPRRLS